MYDEYTDSSFTAIDECDKANVDDQGNSTQRHDDFSDHGGVYVNGYNSLQKRCMSTIGAAGLMYQNGVIFRVKWMTLNAKR